MISISVKALFYERGGGLPLLAADQMLSRSLSWSDVSFLDFFFVCLSPPTFVSHHNAFFSLELASISQSTQTCFLTQLIQMPTQCFMYISCPITEPSIFNGDKILVPININPTLFVLFVFHSTVHYPSLTLSFCDSLWFMPSSFFFYYYHFFLLLSARAISTLALQICQIMCAHMHVSGKKCQFLWSPSLSTYFEQVCVTLFT